MDKILLYIIFGSLFGFIAMISTYFILVGKQKKNKVIKKKHRTRSQKILWRLRILRLYRWTMAIKFGRRLIKFIRERYELSGLYEEEEIRFKAMLNLLILAVLMLSSFLVILITNRSLVNTIVVVLIITMISKSISNISILRMRKQMLNDQIILNKRIRLKYYETRIVDDAIELASDELMEEGYQNIARQGYKLLRVLLSKDKDKMIIRFNEEAPNKYLKLLLGLSYLTQDYGDTKIDNVSSYAYSLKLLNQEIRLEYMKKDRTGYILNAVDALIMVPLLFVDPVIKWLSNTFYDLETYFKSSLGFVTALIMYLVVLVCYYVLQRIQEDTDEKEVRKRKPIKLPKFMLYIIAGLKPMRYTKRMANLEKKLREAKENREVDQYYFRKIVFAFGGFIACLFVVIAIHQISASNILELPTVTFASRSVNVGSMSAEERVAAEDLTKLDKEIINSGNTEAEINSYLKENYQDYTESEIKLITERVLTKAEAIRSEHLKWYEFLIAIMIGFLFYIIPDIMLEIRRKIYKAEEDDEVSLYNSLILMLINTHGVDAYVIVAWLNLFSRIYKEDLEVTITEFDAGAEKALDKLRVIVENESFRELIENLKRAITHLSIKEAFDELISDKEYFFDQRKEEIERTIKRKIMIANVISMAPTITLITIYLVIPILYMSMTGFSNLDINNLGQ